MAKVELLGRKLDIAPFKLGALRKAAPHIDALNKANITGLLAELDPDKPETMPSIERMLEPLPHMLAVIAIGTSKLDPELTAEFLEDNIGFSEMAAVAQLFKLIVEESGLRPDAGEAKAPSALVMPEGASTSSSATSSET